MRNSKGQFVKGGKEWSGKKHSEISKAKMSAKRIGLKPTEESRIKMSETHKRLGTKPPSMKGKKATVEHRRKNGEAHIGDKNHFWKGGVTPINIKIRRSLEYRLWRDAVFQRDGYKCVWCGDDKGGNLNADHIKPFALYPELRFAIDNGRTLCEECHKTTDTFGNRKIYRGD